MEIDFFCPRWGAETIDWSTFAKKVKTDGFSGVEVFPLADMANNVDMIDALSDQGLNYILLHTELVEGADFPKYLRALEHNLYTLLDYQNYSARPKCIVSQTGREYYNKEQMKACFALCDRIAQESGIPIHHETHRNKWSFAAHVVNDYLIEFPQLTLALDLSHWVCVSESYLEDQQEAVERAIKRSKHLHARVGHPQGPQVTDPKAPENREALNRHLAWWDSWILHQAAAGTERATITPEFGPHPYMAYLPNTTTPLADQYAINHWMKELLQQRFAALTAS